MKKLQELFSYSLNFFAILGVLGIVVLHIIVFSQGLAVNSAALAEDSENITVIFHLDADRVFRVCGRRVGETINALDSREILSDEGLDIDWYLEGSNTKVNFPYTISESDFTCDNTITFYGVIRKRIMTVTIVGCDKTAEMTCEYGDVLSLPNEVFGNNVIKWYVDFFETEYDFGAVTRDLILYPLLDCEVIISIDNVDYSVKYGDYPPVFDDTDTHEFSGLADRNGDDFHKRIIKEVDLTTKYERVRYRINIFGRGVTYKAVGENLLFDDLASFGDAFSSDENFNDEITFPFVLSDDVTVYPYPITTAPYGITVEEYNVMVICEHAEIDADVSYRAGDLVSFTIYNIEDGYNVRSVLVSCNGEPVVTGFDGNVVTFIMPEGDIEIYVLFESAAGQGKLTKDEIIAISVVSSALGAGLIGLAVYYLLKKKGVIFGRSAR